MRNPKCHRDEIILALNLYFKLEPGQIHSRNNQIIELSELLNGLSVHEDIPDRQNFRSANAVALKLGNFLAIDPGHDGKGMEGGSKLDKEIFSEFSEDRNRLSEVAISILRESTVSENLSKFKIFEDESIFSVKEGGVKFEIHKRIERNNLIINKKKEGYFQKNGKLDCEVCGFDFYEYYGELGRGFIECHHRIPLSEINDETRTELDDLALLCSNCHSMAHRESDVITIALLKELVVKNRTRLNY
jgi:5-methylcytosine-specific restriction protein A